jgi:hypothetical protein
MSTPLFASVGGHAVTSLRACVPSAGAWFVDADLPEHVALSGSVEVKIGALSMRGVVAPEFSGAFAQASKVRVVAGAGGWARAVGPLHYHADNGVKARTIADDAARGVGETIGTFAPTSALVGIDFVRAAGPASRVLEQLLGEVPWWVDCAGVTHAGPRPPTEVTGPYEVLQVDPRARTVSLALEDPTAIGIGSTLRARLDAPLVVRELELVVSAGALRATAWCGGEQSSAGRIARSLRAIVREEIARELGIVGAHEYRLVQMSTDRVELQAVRKRDGLPDTLPISMWPGVAGAWADLSPGTHVLVEFTAGDPTQPRVVAFAPLGADAWRPARLMFDVTAHIALGCGVDDGAPVGRIGDPVTVGYLSATGGGTAPIALVLSPTATGTPGEVHLTAAISGGSSKVRAG